MGCILLLGTTPEIGALLEQIGFATREEESHLISGNCEVYGDIRDKFENLDDDQNLVKFFNEVLARRDVLEDEEREM